MQRWISSENYYTRPKRWINLGCSTDASGKAATREVKLNLVGKQWNVRMKSSFRGEKFSCTSKCILPTPVTNCSSSFCTLLPGLQQNISLFPVKGVKKNKSLKKNSQGKTLFLQFLGWLSSPTHPQFKEAKIKCRRFNSTQGCGLHTSILLIQKRCKKMNTAIIRVPKLLLLPKHQFQFWWVTCAQNQGLEVKTWVGTGTERNISKLFNRKYFKKETNSLF